MNLEQKLLKKDKGIQKCKGLSKLFWSGNSAASHDL